jgi:predicted ATPase
VGKTRLALQVGAEVLDHYPDGVWLIDFAPITDPELVSSVIAKEICMRGYRYTRRLRRIAGAERRVEHIGCE